MLLSHFGLTQFCPFQPEHAKKDVCETNLEVLQRFTMKCRIQGVCSRSRRVLLLAEELANTLQISFNVDCYQQGSQLWLQTLCVGLREG
ncbi:hypothetical protein PBY51_016922 [Eleginops maclovinus]|uniref:Uncharacterized protein n=1 Tax=Eleginops maclovinus TaxID=56733 RepID=A0AAN8AAA3_ELEMC|nr:hypothetical protein PBY51_016922 [Eleginops maclovinus]